MTEFLLNLWVFARPYRVRLFLGVMTGILSGAMAPLLMVAIWVVSTLVFQPAGAAAKQPFGRLPAFIQPWIENVRAGMGSGLQGTFPGGRFCW